MKWDQVGQVRHGISTAMFKVECLEFFNNLDAMFFILQNGNFKILDRTKKILDQK